jgi:hypothetical protein
MCNLYRGPAIDASYQVSVHLAKGFQRRRLKCEKSTDEATIQDQSRDKGRDFYVRFNKCSFKHLEKGHNFHT